MRLTATPCCGLNFLSLTTTDLGEYGRNYGPYRHLTKGEFYEKMKRMILQFAGYAGTNTTDSDLHYAQKNILLMVIPGEEGNLLPYIKAVGFKRFGSPLTRTGGGKMSMYMLKKGEFKKPSIEKKGKGKGK